MQTTDVLLGLLRERGKRGLPLTRIYRQLFNPNLYLTAYRRIYRNKGAMTPSVTEETADGMSLEKIDTIIQAVRRERYQWQPARRTYLLKKNGKKRPLGMPVWSDKLLAEVMRMILDAYFDETFSDHSHGFRSERGCHTALRDIYHTWKGAVWLIEGDIAKFFDRISQEWLLHHIPMDKTILRKWLKAGFIDKNVLQATDEGTPQGGICSPVLANMTLDGLEKKLREKFPKPPRKSSKEKVNVIRFADDFIITGRSKEVLEDEVKPLVEQFMRERGLELSPEKTLITHIENGFDFLGQHLRKYKGKLLITPSRKNIHTFLEGIRKVIRDNKQATTGNLIAQLNPKIRGWANYHRHVVSSETFSKVDHAIFCALWQWAKRRHPKKPIKWMKKKYFQSIAGQNWVFQGEILGHDGTAQPIRLFKAKSVAIQRHIKIQNEANPYDLDWETYFEKRLDVKMAHTLKGKRKLLYLWKQQDGLCPLCNRKITKLTGWHSHHIIWRSQGGGDEADNRVLLHPDCHERLHRQGLTVSKPRPLLGVRKA